MEMKLMNDKILDLYWQRDERALEMTADRFGGYCYAIAFRLLGNAEDAEECVNDTYQAAWDSIPPNHPENLAAYLGKLSRRISMKIWRKRDAAKRGKGEMTLSLEELESCIPSSFSMDTQIDKFVLKDTINRYLAGAPRLEREMFVCRYYYGYSVGDLCHKYGFSKSKVESMLHRTRRKLRSVLEEVYC